MNIAFCTIASANYLARVQVLEKSLVKYHSIAELHILLCESQDVCEKIAVKSSRKFFSPADVGCDKWQQMAFYYDITEYNSALKPFLLETLLQQGYEAVIYFDPNIEIYGNLGELSNLLATYHAVLTPHVCKPIPDDNKHPSMDAYIRTGQFNLGFIGMSACPEVFTLLHWWQNVLVEKCLFSNDPTFFVDQFWAAAIPSLLEKTYILRDPAYNMAYWNIFQRKLENDGDKWITDSGELRFFHFSGLNDQNLTKVSNHQDRVSAPVGSALYRLLYEYFEKIKKQEWSVFSNYQYSFGFYYDGEPITNDERKTYLSMSSKEREDIGNPFNNNSRPQNTIRLRYKEILEMDNTDYDLLPIFKARSKQLEKEKQELLNSMSWKITAPLRLLYTWIKLILKRS